MNSYWATINKILKKPNLYFRDQLKPKLAVQFFGLATILWILATPINPWVRLAYGQRLILWLTYWLIEGILYGIINRYIFGKNDWKRTLIALPFSYLPLCIAIFGYPFFFLIFSTFMENLTIAIIVYWVVVFLYVIILQMFVLFADTEIEKPSSRLFLIPIVVILVQGASIVSTYGFYKLLLWWMFVY